MDGGKGGRRRTEEEIYEPVRKEGNFLQTVALVLASGLEPITKLRSSRDVSEQETFSFSLEHLTQRGTRLHGESRT